MADDLKSRTVSSLIWKFLERAGNQLVLLLVQIVMARLLSPQDFGFLAIMLVFVNLGNVFVQSGLGAALVQNPDVGETDCATVFWISFGMSLVITAGIFFCAPMIAHAYGASELVWPLRVLSLMMILNAYNSVQVAIVQRALQFKRVFVATTWSVIASAVLGISSAVAGAGIWALVVQQVSYQAVNCLSLYFQTRWVPSLVFSKKRAVILYRFGWKILACNVLNTGYLSLYDLVIGAQFSASQLGLVSQGKKYPSALGSMLDGAIQPVMMSSIARVQSDRDRAKRLMRRAMKSSTFVVFPAMTLLAVVSPALIPFLLGDQWREAVPFLQMYCFVYALLPIHSSNLSALSGMGHSGINLILEIVKKVIGLTALAVGAFVIHDVYVLVATAMLTGLIATFVNAYPNKRVIGYSYGEQLRDIAPSFALSVVAGGLAFLCGCFVLNEVLRILVEIAVMTAAYLALAKMLHLESLEYLLATLEEMLGSRRRRRA